MNLEIIEEKSKKNEEIITYYIREKPYIPGYSINTTALSKDAAEWTKNRIMDSWQSLAYRDSLLKN